MKDELTPGRRVLFEARPMRPEAVTVTLDGVIERVEPRVVWVRVSAGHANEPRGAVRLDPDR